jgi:hypothetical protein
MTSNYNLKMEAIRNFRVSGMIWYQGESDVGWSGERYARAFDLMQRSYTELYKYKNGLMPIICTQLMQYYYSEDGYVLTNEYYEKGLPVRYIQDVEDISKFSDDFVSLFAWILARDVCLELTDSPEKFSMIENILPTKIAEVCGVDAQENKPIRIERSNLRAARLGLRYNEVKA